MHAVVPETEMFQAAEPIRAVNNRSHALWRFNLPTPLS